MKSPEPKTKSLKSTEPISLPNKIVPIRVRRRAAVHPRPNITMSTMAAPWVLKVYERSINELKPSARSARTHSPKQIQQIANSIKKFRFVTPVLIDANDEIVAGHGRVAAAKLLGLKCVPTARLDHLSPDEIRAYCLADNRLAEQAGWDEDLLRLELGHLIEIDFEVDLTGFETPEVDILLNGAETESYPNADPADEVGPVAERAVSRRGDLWLLDNHRILCGDARDPADYERLLGGELAQMTFTDPPYNVKIDGHVGGLGEIKHRPFAMASGEMSKPEFIVFLTDTLLAIRNASQDGALVYTCMDGAHLHELLTAGHSVYAELKTVICWAKTNAGMGSLYRSQTEFIVLWKVGKAAHINNIELGKHGRYRTTLWTYAGANTFRKGRMADLAAHPTVKPCVMVMDAIKDCSKPNGIILDPFGGSGTTLIAAHKTKRRGYLVEYDPLYVDVAIRRWEELFKREARHAETGLSFAEMTATRLGDAVAAEAAREGGCDVR